MKKLLTRIGLALLLVAMIVTVVACGPDTNDDETTPAETTTAGTPEETTAGDETTGEDVTTGEDITTAEDVTTAGTPDETIDEPYVDTTPDDTAPDIF